MAKATPRDCKVVDLGPTSATTMPTPDGTCNVGVQKSPIMSKTVEVVRLRSTPAGHSVVQG
jgi:hypothetical protein